MYPVVSPSIFNVTLTAADTEYSQALPAGTKRFSISIRDGAAANNFRVAYVTGKVATPTAPYLKYPCTAEYYEEDLIFWDATTVYIAGSNAGDVAQIIAWT